MTTTVKPKTILDVSERDQKELRRLYQNWLVSRHREDGALSVLLAASAAHKVRKEQSEEGWLAFGKLSKELDLSLELAHDITKDMR